MGTTEDNAADDSGTTLSAPAEDAHQGAYDGWRERHVYRNRSRKHAWRLVVGTIGAAVVVLGFILIPFPGPGWLIVFLGLGILATEFDWADRLLGYAKHKVHAWTEWTNRQSLVIRLLIGLLVLCFAAAMVVVSLRLAGSPEWVPGWVPFMAEPVG